MGASFLKKLSVLLAVLLCCVLTLALPVVSYAVSADSEVQANSDYDSTSDESHSYTAGEVSSGEPEAVLQIDKVAFGQLFRSVLLLAYPTVSSTPGIPAYYAFSKSDSSLYSILTKGP